MKLHFFTLLFVVAIFSSCETDDDPTSFTPSSDNFVGVYNTVTLTESGEDSFTFDGETTTSTFSEVGSDFNLVWTFTEANTFTIIGSYTTTYTETENGITETDVEVETVNQSGTYSLNAANDQLVLTGNDDDEFEDSDSFNITTFTQDVLEFNRTETDSGSDFNSMSTISFRLEKQ